MPRFLFVSVFALTAVLSARAEDPKREPTAAEIKKQMADLETLIAKKKAERTKAQEQFKAIEAEGKKVSDAWQKKVKEQLDASKKTLVAPKAKATAAKEAAEKVRKAAKEFADTHNTLTAKYKASTDPKEMEEIGKKIAEMKAAFPDKLAELKKTEAAAKAAEDEYFEALTAAKAAVERVARAGDEAKKVIQTEAFKVRQTLAGIQDELDKAERDIRRLKDRLADIEKK